MDLIDREQLMNYIRSRKINIGKLAHDVVMKQPNIQMQEPKTGHWIDAKVGKMFPSNDYKCSECGNILDFDGVNCGRGDANFCPNCGARMKVDE